MLRTMLYYNAPLYRLVVVHFWAPWSQPCRQMNDVMAELAKEHTAVKFLKVSAGWPACSPLLLLITFELILRSKVK